MYQVHINKTRSQIKQLTKTKNIKKIPVQNKRVVCFSVPNGTLITRNNGHIAIQGNCKHGAHLVRLMKMCKEILETGEVQVKRPDAEELLAIRSGAWSFDELIEWAEKMEEECKALYETSSIPHKVNHKFIDNLCVEILEEALSNGL